MGDNNHPQMLGLVYISGFQHVTGHSKALRGELKEFPPPRELHYGIAEHLEILGAVNSFEENTTAEVEYRKAHLSSLLKDFIDITNVMRELTYTLW